MTGRCGVGGALPDDSAGGGDDAVDAEPDLDGAAGRLPFGLRVANVHGASSPTFTVPPGMRKPRPRGPGCHDCLVGALVTATNDDADLLFRHWEKVPARAKTARPVCRLGRTAHARETAAVTAMIRGLVDARQAVERMKR